MRTLGKVTATLGVVGAIAASSVIPASALDIYIGDRPHGYYGGGRYATWNGCPPDWTIQGGECKPYRHGPWDYAPRYRHWYR